VVVGKLNGSLFLATGSLGGVADTLAIVEESSVSIAKVCKRERADRGVPGVESPAADEAAVEARLSGVLGPMLA
jgi:hypothetical protein